MRSQHPHPLHHCLDHPHLGPHPRLPLLFPVTTGKPLERVKIRPPKVQIAKLVGAKFAHVHQPRRARRRVHPAPVMAANPPSGKRPRHLREQVAHQVDGDADLREDAGR